MSLHQTAPENSRKDWRTPDRVLDLVRKLGTIGLDPCTWPDNPCGAATFFTEGALERVWRGFGNIYVNPPYGREISRWCERAISEMACCVPGGEREELVMLVPANTDSRWYDRLALNSDARCEVRGRLRFKGAPASAMFGSAVFYFGTRPVEFCGIFSELGRCYSR